MTKARMLKKVGRRQERGSTVKGLVSHINNFKLGSHTMDWQVKEVSLTIKHVENTYQPGGGQSPGKSNEAYVAQ